MTVPLGNTGPWPTGLPSVPSLMPLSPPHLSMLALSASAWSFLLSASSHPGPGARHTVIHVLTSSRAFSSQAPPLSSRHMCLLVYSTSPVTRPAGVTNTTGPQAKLDFLSKPVPTIIFLEDGSSLFFQLLRGQSFVATSGIREQAAHSPSPLLVPPLSRQPGWPQLSPTRLPHFCSCPYLVYSPPKNRSDSFRSCCLGHLGAQGPLGTSVWGGPLREQDAGGAGRHAS